MNISKSPKVQENAFFFQKINNFSKIIRENVFQDWNLLAKIKLVGYIQKIRGNIFQA